jgi:hypothetical protein
LCAEGDCSGWCPRSQNGYVRMTNSKAFLTPSTGLNSWSGRMEVIGFKCYDCGLSIQALASGFWIDDLSVECRTGEPLLLPATVYATSIAGDGFGWYDTDQEHIITRATFQNCGFNPNQSDDDPAGCGIDPSTGCSSGSSVFSFLTHSSEFPKSCRCDDPMEEIQVNRSRVVHIHSLTPHVTRRLYRRIGNAKCDHGLMRQEVFVRRLSR